jgi:transcriptional activator SPT8
LFTGGDDGFIRKFDMYASINGESMLTGVQKHGLVDTISRGGSLVSAWECVLAEPPKPVQESAIQQPVEPQEDKISPVYSIDVHSEGIWCIVGTEAGPIHLYTVRHQEGKLIHTFRGHKDIVSVLKIAPNELTFLSGSWDKTIKLWDLNTGEVLKHYKDSKTQIMDIQFHPLNPNQFLACSFDGIVYVYDITKKDPIATLKSSISQSPPWSLSSCWSTDGTRIYVGRRNSTVSEIDLAQQISLRTFVLPNGSGPVFHVQIMDDRYIVM